MNEQMLLELTQAANNLDEARLECELSNRALEQAEENMKVSKSQYEVGLENYPTIWKHKRYGNKLTRLK